MLKDLLAYFRRPMGRGRGDDMTGLGGAGPVLKREIGGSDFFIFFNKALCLASPLSLSLSECLQLQGWMDEGGGGGIAEQSRTGSA